MVILNSDNHDHFNIDGRVPRINEEEEKDGVVCPPEGKVRGSNGGIYFSL